MKTPALFLILLCLLSCNRSVATIDGVERPRKPKDAKVDIYITSKPTRPYKEIALFRADGDAEQIVEKAKKAVRNAGGDAVIFTDKGVVTGAISMRTFDVQNGVVIIYTDKEAN